MILSFEKGQTLDDVIAALVLFKKILSINAQLVTKTKVYFTLRQGKIPILLAPETYLRESIQELIYRDGILQIKHPKFIKPSDPKWYIAIPSETKTIGVPIKIQTLNQSEQKKLDKIELKKMAEMAAERRYHEEREKAIELRKKRQEYYQKKKAKKNVDPT
jgi:hypothetical protein